MALKIYRKGYAYGGAVFVRSICNRVSPIGFSARSIYNNRVSPVGFSSSSWNNCFYGSSPAALQKSLTSNDNLQPWMMLPPESVVDGGDSRVINFTFKFYSLAEKRVVSVPSRLGSDSASIFHDIKHDKMEFVGSSHGWLAMFHQFKYDLFLYNPLSGRRINLPPITALPRPQGWNPSAAKVILSCSPDEQEDCRAMMCYEVDELAFCRPGHSTQWTRIGNLGYYEDLVYSDKLGAFFCATRQGHFELWDLPREDHHIVTQFRAEKEFVLEDTCDKSYYLVPLVEGGDFLLVTRRVVGMNICNHQTVGFDVYRYDTEERALRYVDHNDANCFDGLALFIGMNHSFAVSSPLLRPNSIYFTDGGVNEPYSHYEDEGDYGGHDIGIYNYHDRTFEPCYYPRDVRSIRKLIPKPIWFTPGGN